MPTFEDYVEYTRDASATLLNGHVLRVKFSPARLTGDFEDRLDRYFAAIAEASEKEGEGGVPTPESTALLQKAHREFHIPDEDYVAALAVWWDYTRGGEMIPLTPENVRACLIPSDRAAVRAAIQEAFLPNPTGSEEPKTEQGTPASSRKK